jgi:hypothetical protein
MFRASKPKRGIVTAPVAAAVAAPVAAPVAQPERAASRRPGQLLEERARKTQRKSPAVDIAGMIDRVTDWQLGK